MVYLDTSAIVKLYVREPETLAISRWLRTNNQAIPLTQLHGLELTNALHLKALRGEISPKQIQTILTLFAEHHDAGVFYRPAVDWAKVWDKAIELSTTHTATLGTRSLDILHVAAALSLVSRRFVTFDAKQAQLATAAGLNVVRVVLAG